METDAFSVLRASVSGDRLGPYLAACAGDQAAAARLYAWNIRVSAAFRHRSGALKWLAVTPCTKSWPRCLAVRIGGIRLNWDFTIPRKELSVTRSKRLDAGGTRSHLAVWWRSSHSASGSRCSARELTMRLAYGGRPCVWLSPDTTDVAQYSTLNLTPAGGSGTALLTTSRSIDATSKPTTRAFCGSLDTCLGTTRPGCRHTTGCLWCLPPDGTLPAERSRPDSDTRASGECAGTPVTFTLAKGDDGRP